MQVPTYWTILGIKYGDRPVRLAVVGDVTGEIRQSMRVETPVLYRIDSTPPKRFQVALTPYNRPPYYAHLAVVFHGALRSLAREHASSDKPPSDSGFSASDFV
jgi:hypothetical protein